MIGPPPGNIATTLTPTAPINAIQIGKAIVAQLMALHLPVGAGFTPIVQVLTGIR